MEQESTVISEPKPTETETKIDTPLEKIPLATTSIETHVEPTPLESPKEPAPLAKESTAPPPAQDPSAPSAPSSVDAPSAIEAMLGHWRLASSDNFDPYLKCLGLILSVPFRFHFLTLLDLESSILTCSYCILHIRFLLSSIL